MNESCGPRLTPLSGAEDFVLLRCDASCFRLVLPFLSIHLSSREMKLARTALKCLWPKGAQRKPEQEENMLFQAFRCPGGHCHLVCQGTINLCMTEKAAKMMEREMAAQEVWDDATKTKLTYLA